MNLEDRNGKIRNADNRRNLQCFILTYFRLQKEEEAEEKFCIYFTLFYQTCILFTFTAVTLNCSMA